MPFGRELAKGLKKITPLIGAVVGTAIGGPVGGIIGGGLAGQTTRGGKNKIKGFLGGAAQGAMFSGLAPMIGGALPGSFGGGSGFMNSITGSKGPSLLNQLGLSSAPSSGGGLGFMGNFGQRGIMEGPGGMMGPGSFLGRGLGGIPGMGQSGGQGMGGFMQGPLGSFGVNAFKGIANQLFGRGRPEGGGAPQSLTEQQAAPFMESIVNPVRGSLNMPSQGGESGEGGEKGNRVTAIIQNPGSSALEKIMQLLQYLEGDKGIKKTPKPQAAQKKQAELQAQPEAVFKRGGYVRGNAGGQDDNVKRSIPEQSFVQDATTVSLLGDGNSLNGMKKLKKMEDDFLRSGIVRNPATSYRVRAIRAKVSPGEFVHSRAFVDALGSGDNNKGVKILNNMRKNVREHKGVSKFLPPKSKPIAHYMGGVTGR